METQKIQPLQSETTSNQSPLLDSLSQSQDTYEKLNELFSEQDQQQKTILEARETLGDSAKELTDEQVYDLATEMQHLVDTWLEEFERKTFDGKTLKELLNLEL